MKNKIFEYLPVFFLGSFLGWIWEVIYTLINQGVIANRGVLHGPWLLIYGFGCVLMLLIKNEFAKNSKDFFVKSIFVCGLLEYITSWGLQVIFNRKWWDYSDELINLNGRISFSGLLFFGVAGFLVVYKLMPYISNYIKTLTVEKLTKILVFLACLFLVDVVYSFSNPNVGYGITSAIKIFF